MKNQGFKIALLALLFMAVVGVGLFLALKPVMTKTKTKTYELSEKALPIVWIEDEDNRTDNCLRGYTGTVDEQLVSRPLIPVGENGILHCSIENCPTLRSVRYQIRRISDDGLVEDTKLENWNTDENQNVTADMNLTGLLEDGSEYNMDLIVETDSHEEIHHYFRICVMYDPDLLWQMAEFGLEFSEATFDKEKAADLLPVYISNDGSMGSSDYGYVNLHSPYRMLTWGDLNPQINGQKQLQFCEIEATQITMSLTYSVTVADGDDSGMYDVEEDYVIRYRNERFYLLDYSRTMDREFEAESAVSGNRINLGIRSEYALADTLGADFDTAVVYDASGDGTVMAFAVDGTLYSYAVQDGTITEVFGYTYADSCPRRLYKNAGHDIQIVSLSEDGSMDFLVYGYIEQGSHEGTNGIILYHYDPENDQIEEHFYVETSLPYEIMRSGVGTNAYINDQNVCYLVYGNSIYAIVLDGTEYYQVTDELISGQLATANDGSLIAWEQHDAEGEAGNISVMDTTSGNTVLLSVTDTLAAAKTLGMAETPEADACSLKVLGFIDNDIVYGIYRVSDVYTENGIEYTPMFFINIADGISGETTGGYLYDNVYVTAITMETSRMALTRVTKSGDSYEPLDADYIVLNTAMAETEQVSERVALKNADSDNLLREYYLQNLNPQTAADRTSIQSIHYLTGDNREIDAENVDFEGKWLVYGHGRLAAIEENLTEAVALAGKYCGKVCDRDGQVYWAMVPKADSVSLTLSVTANPGCSQTSNMLAVLLGGSKNASEIDSLLKKESTLEEIAADSGQGKYIELYGCELNVLNYYLDRACPVAGILEDGSICIITGYDADSYRIYWIESGESEDLNMEEASTFFEENADRFAVVL